MCTSKQCALTQVCCPAPSQLALEPGERSASTMLRWWMQLQAGAQVAKACEQMVRRRTSDTASMPPPPPCTTKLTGLLHPQTTAHWIAAQAAPTAARGIAAPARPSLPLTPRLPSCAAVRRAPGSPPARFSMCSNRSYGNSHASRPRRVNNPTLVRHLDPPAGRRRQRPGRARGCPSSS